MNLYDPTFLCAARQCLQASADAYKSVTLQTELAHVLIVDDVPRNQLIIAFRGTENLTDWRTDMDALMVPAAAGPLNPNNEQDGMYLHMGFMGALNQVFPLILPIVEKGPEAILLTGHSLGGAMAMLCALALDRAGHEATGVYTFGQPRVGNAAFASAYDRADVGSHGVTSPTLKERTFRFVNEEDIVPRVPGVLLGYRHAGHEVFFPSSGGWKLDPSVWLKAISDGIGTVRDYLATQAGKPTLSCLMDHHIAEYQLRFAKEFGAAALEVTA